MAIDLTTIVITRTGFVISAHTEDGEVAKESYIHGSKGFDCINGNFADEQLFGNNDDLVATISNMFIPVAELAEQMRKQ